MRVRGLITTFLLAAAGCDNDTTLPLPIVDGGGADRGPSTGPDLLPPWNPCPDGSGLEFAGVGGLPFFLGGDGSRQPNGTMARDSRVALDGGAVILGGSGGLPEPRGSYLFSLPIACHGPCILKRIGWTVEAPPNTWANVATRVADSFDNLDGGGFTPRGGVDYVDVGETHSGGMDVQWSVELFSGKNDAGTPRLRALYACYRY